jgi:TfoX/Sxy family transcriptional regulator of competence genes
MVMAEPYLTRLKSLADQWVSADPRIGALECRHFFSGAAVYRNGVIVASLTPVGLAFKVPAEVHDELMSSGLASPLRYFPKAPVKRDYVLFPAGMDLDAHSAARLLLGGSPKFGS